MKLIISLLILSLLLVGCSEEESVPYADLVDVEEVDEPCYIEMEGFERIGIEYSSPYDLPTNITINDSKTIFLDNISVDGLKILDYPNTINDLTDEKVRITYFDGLEIISTNKANYMRCGLDIIIEMVEKNVTHLAEEVCYTTPLISSYRIEVKPDTKVKVCFNEER